MKNTWRHYLRRLAATSVVGGSAAWSSAMCYAVQLAYDDASDPVYNNGWQAGDDGGTGVLGAWNFDGSYGVPQQAIDDGAQAGATGSSPYNDIGRAWTLFNPNGKNPGMPNPANPPQGGTDITRVGRPITGGLQVGSTLKMVIDNPIEQFFFRGWTLKLNNGGASQCYAGDNCTTPAYDPGSINPRMAIGTFEYFTYGQWYMTDVEGAGVPLYSSDTNNPDPQPDFVGTDSGVRIEFTLTGVDTFNAKMIPLDNPGATFEHTGTLDGIVGTTIDWIQIEFYNTDSDFYPSIVPGGSQPADYNGNGKVDAADYPIWRKFNDTGFDLQNEVTGVSTGSVTDADYDEWRKRFGESSASPARATDFYIRSIEITTPSGSSEGVPEPGIFIYLIAGAAGLCAAWRKAQTGLRIARWVVRGGPLTKHFGMSGNMLSVSLPRCGKVGVIFTLCVFVAGCNRSGLNLAPVEGVVTFKGAPLEGAGVLFLPATGPFAMGKTDAEGRFSLMTANHEGALVGDHRVIITKAETTTRQIPGERLPRYDTKYLIPQKYSDAENSGLAKTVVDDDNEFEFNLE